MEDRIVYTVLLLMISIVGFFMTRLIKSIDDCRKSIDDLRDHLTVYITKYEYIEKQVEKNVNDIGKLHAQVHSLSNDFAEFRHSCPRSKG